MPQPMRTKPVTASQVRSHAGKAQELADAAASELQVGRFIAATSLAVHAGINAADAIRGARLGQRATIFQVPSKFRSKSEGSGSRHTATSGPYLRWAACFDTPSMTPISLHE